MTARPGAGSISGAAVSGAPGIGGAPIGWGFDTPNTYTQAISANSVTLDGGVYPNGLDTTYYWQYGTSTNYGLQTQATDIGGGAGVVGAGAVINGLVPSTTYHYRLVAQNSAGTTYGYDYTAATLGPLPGNTTPPLILGNAIQGQVLGVSLGAWTGTIASWAFQWQRSADGSTWTNIIGATNMNYVLAAADIGQKVRVIVTATNPSGSATVLSTAFGPVTSGVPVNTVAPAIAGTPDQGYVLSVSSTWNPAGSSYTYVWERSTDGQTWSAIPGAASSSYTLQGADDGASVRAVVTAVNAFGQASATSPAVGPVSSNPPVNTLAPVLTGTTQRTYTLSATQGTWSGAWNVYGYQWQRSADGQSWSAISGATASAYTLGQLDEGDLVRVLVSASNPDGVATQPSNPTAAVISPYPPANIVAPVASGTAERTATLAASSGTWTGPGLAYGYQWQRDAGAGYVNIAGATSSSYTLGAADEGAVVRVIVSASNVDGTIQEASQPTTIVQDAVPVNLTAPSIIGAVQRTSVLDGNQGVWGGLGNSYAEQWQRSADNGKTWSAIAGATGLSYTLAVADEGAIVRLLVTASNADGSAAVASLPTVTVPGSPPANSVAPTVTGTAQRGYTLEGTQGTWSGIGNTYSYQWQRSTDGQTWTNISSQTGTGYMLTPADENATVRLLVTATNPDGTLAVPSQSTTTVLSAIPVNTVPPALAGIAQRDSVVSATQGTWSGIGNTYTYRWQRSTDNGSTWQTIAGAGAISYTVGTADEASVLRVQVTAANLDGSVSAESTATAAVPSSPPVETAVPVITGTALRTTTLTATQGTWSGIENTYAYQWQESADGGSSWQNIPFATTITYTLGQADEMMLVRVQVSATNLDGSQSAQSAAVGPVQGAVPANNSLPSITGTALRAQVLSGSPGSWSGLGNSYAYHWQRCDQDGNNCQNIAGATGVSYTLAVADEQGTVRLLVTATNVDGPGGVSALSAPTATIPASPPVSEGAPSITGIVQRAQVLTASPGTWSGIGNTYSYQWQGCDASGQNCQAIAGATTATYTLTMADENGAVRVQVTAANPDDPGGVSAFSAPSATVPSSPPVSTVAGAITGTTQRGQTLTATPGTWTGIGNTYTYQWQRGSGSGHTDIAGATTATYVIGVADENATLRTLITATNPDGTASAPSQVTATVPSAPPTNTVLPAISGTAQRTFTLASTQGTWGGIGNTYSYQWQRSGDGQSWTNILVATATTYTLAVADEGNEIRLQITATNPDGTLVVASPPSARVLAAAPVNTVAPTISGTAQRTGTLTGTPGNWSGIGNTYTYQWQRSPDGQSWTSVLGQTAVTYQLRKADEGSYLRLQVTATNPDNTVTVSSPPSGLVTAYPPQNTVSPVLTGTAQRAGTLTAILGTWTGPDNTYAYQWQDSSDAQTWTNIAGATTVTYTLGKADEGSYLRVIVTATNPDATVSAASVASGAVAPNAPVNSMLPQITGTPQRASTLTGTPGSWSGPDDTYAYQWQRSADGAAWTNITGATSASYTLGQADEGDYVRVLVFASNPDAANVRAASVATGAVQAAPPQNTVAPQVTGQGTLGAILSASAGTWTPATGVTYTYQWERSSPAGYQSIPGANAPTYTLAAADVGQTVRVVVTAGDIDGTQNATSSASTSILQPPQNLTAPAAPSGTLQNGSTLSADSGTWDTPGASFTYTWLRCPAAAVSASAGCTTIGIGSTYTLQSADVGYPIGVGVSATARGGTSAPVTSALTAPISGRPLVNNTAPSIDGNPVVPQTLTANPGLWSVTLTGMTYSWERCDPDGSSNCTVVANGNAYTLSGADDGHTIVLYATASVPGQMVTAQSTALTVHSQPLPQDTVAPTVTGFAQRTQVLSAGAGTWTNSPALSEQWQRCDSGGQNCQAIAGATGSSYLLGSADEGHAITVRVTATNSTGQAQASAKPSAAVAADPPIVVHPPALTATGTSPAYQQDVEIDIASSAAWQTTPDTTYADAWQRCDQNGQNCQAIAGASSNYYIPGAADVAHTIELIQTATNTDGSVNATSRATPTILPGAPRWKVLPLISTDPGNVGDALTITPGVWSGPALGTDTVQLMRCIVTCSQDGQANPTGYTIATADLGAILRVLETATDAAGSASVWSARYVGPVISAAAGTAVLKAAASINVKNTQGRTLATAQLQSAVAGPAAQISAYAAVRSPAAQPAARMVKLRRARGLTGKLSAWVCPIPVGSAPPARCTAKTAVRSAGTIKLPASMKGQLRVVVVRR